MAKSRRTTSGRESRGKTTQRPAPKKPVGKRPAPKQPAARSSSTRRSPQAPSSLLGTISAERKMDVAGVILAVIGLLTMLSLLSGTRGVVTGAWVSILRQIAGWGVLILPLTLIGIGAWLLLRHTEKFPLPSLERLVGILLLFVNLLAWLHLLPGGGWELAKAGRGGGYVGALFERGLVTSIGTLGAVIALIAWFLIGVVFTFDLSIVDLASLFDRKARAARVRHKESAAGAQPRMEKPLHPGEAAATAGGMQGLPANFQPIGGVPSRPVKRPQAPASTPARGDAAEQPGGSTAAPPAEAESMPSPSTWQLPSVEAILDPGTPVAVQANVEADRARKIEETLASFGAPAHVVEIQRGPTVTLFGVEPDFVESRSGRMRVRVAKIVALIDDLSLVLAANVRIQAPVPGRSYVGIEVPNSVVSRVSLREVVESESFMTKRSPLRFALGKDVSGNPVSADMTNMPHLLIAGTTGSGKSVCVNSLLCCFLLNNTPDELRLVLVDPKRVELTGYNGIPHLLAPVVVEPDRVIK
ncbi:MAG: DNA translocase FtsK, partial [Anaerolineae bacterium]|nr:DNA translocase FtsK [Anaerolineae bacterium]